MHLEGSVLPATLLALAEKNGVELPADNEDELRKWYKFEDFNKFIRIYMTICSCIKTEEDVYRIAWDFFLEQKRQNVIYSEITWTAYTHLIQHRLSFKHQAEALFAAADRAESELGVRGLYIFDIPRQVSPAEGLVTAKWLSKNYDPAHIAAIGMGGPETGFPPERHGKAFVKTGRAGVPAVPHAGETEGPASIRGALALPGTVRLGHGVRAAEDPALLSELRDQGIVLEVCPSSNICLNVFPDLEHHSLPALVDAGLKVTINSDDPPMFGTDLNSEYMKIHGAFGYGPDDFYRFNRTAIEAALCEEPVKAAVSAGFDKEWAELLRRSGSLSE